MLADDIKAYLDNPIDPADKKLLGLSTDLDTKKRVKEAVMLLLRSCALPYLRPAMRGCAYSGTYQSAQRKPYGCLSPSVAIWQP